MWIFFLLSVGRQWVWSSRLGHTGHGVHRVLGGRVPPTLSRAGRRGGGGGPVGVWRGRVRVAVSVWWLVRRDASWGRWVGLSGRVPGSGWSWWSRIPHVRGEGGLRSHWSAEAWCGDGPNGLIQWGDSKLKGQTAACMHGK